MSKVVSGTLVIALIGAGGYVWADINDRVPGMLTNSPEIPAPEPFPTVVFPESSDTIEVPNHALDGSIPSAAAVQELVDELVDDEDVLGKSVAVVVSDSQSGEIIASHNPTKRVVPASVQKLLTAVVALDQLNHDKQLRTRVLRSGDSLYLAGEGDMMLAAEAGDVTTTNGYAGLAELSDQAASRLKLDGTETVRLYVDDSIFIGNDIGPWEENSVSAGWVAPVSAFAVDVARKGEGEYAARYRDPEVEAAKIFAERLKERGITVEGKVSHRTFNSPGVAMSTGNEAVIAEVKSAPIADIVSYFLKTSDNAITEIVGHTIALDRGLPASFAGATTAVVQGLEKLGLNTTGVDLVDCSGLGDTSRVTAQLVNDILNLMVSPEYPHLNTGVINLPVGYLNGTLHDRYELRNGRGLVRAKTGSLTGVTALAGTLVTLDQRQLNFVVIADKTEPGAQWGVRRAVDAFVEKVSECGCN
ncbi:D-alanyl-D-alanine carboxypeptidase/D-alanyl-D-alanine-endopeptidase [Populibacterium corticicola]|uniref:D-alanyl-D-alanine carboxypeptidase/D-alanyl-D-alanine-endopeptidase n=1 Tax=Populibacterium corticicola TaxID=1812826 RepID=A0ABW5XIF8_9MICO